MIRDWDEYIFSHTDLGKDITGLPHNIFVLINGKNVRKYPTLLLQIDSEDILKFRRSIHIPMVRNFAVDDVLGLSKTEVAEKVYDKLRMFINLNYKLLIDYWNGNVSTPELYNKVKKLA